MTTDGPDKTRADGTSVQAAPSPESHYSTHIVLTTYPGQSGIDPVPLNWGAKDAKSRGPVVVSRSGPLLKRRNAMGAHGGSYSIYNALAIAAGDLPPDFRPDFKNSEPTFNFPWQPAWADKDKIVAMDPYGHDIVNQFRDELNAGWDIRPTMAVTRANMKLAEIGEAVRDGKLDVDGSIVVDSSGEVRVTKVAVEPVWYLPGVADRFGVSEPILRRTLFEHTGGSYPELITRPDLKIFLPPIGGLTVYIFGPPERVSDENVKLALRIHDECNGSDVFQSDICTCRPYLAFGIREAIREAQNGGSGVVIYFRKEGRALGEVIKYLVYNARKRGGDTADKYFTRTENIAGVRDMRFQALMPDILHWLGIKKIDRMLSMSNMKHDAIVQSGIKILERVPIPEDMIPDDSRVEIDAKINAGYFTTGRQYTMEELAEVKGRGWEKWEDITMGSHVTPQPHVPKAGVWCPAITFFDHSTDTIDFVAQKKYYSYLSKTGLAGLVILGTNSEAFLLTREERAQCIAAAREAVGPDFPLMAGVGAHSTKQVLELAHDAAAAGANYLLVLPPAYFGKATTMGVVKKFFADVARQSPLPVVVYNFPGVCNGVDLDSETITAIVRESAASRGDGKSNVVGVKLTCASVGKITRLAATFKPEEFAVYGGQSDFLIGGLSVGSAGCIAAFANVFPKTASKIYELYKAGKVTEAIDLQQKAALAESPCKSGIASTKYAAAIYSAPLAGIEGAEEKAKPRTPYEEPGEGAKKTVRELMESVSKLEVSI
ncbi:GTP cyclohydrolase N terminal-domain-containing protein [Aspergillus pseudonomiae]|uniref:GTP cyclohydrolase N terminal-domain-containing protein n=2 Tax=Aspergillus subgen. Circumdati TaxID=2720871 RepID=A0A5N7CZN4_9EURO|nr:GTP cyclohydrolase N terminal-domain-containing protein [Aspergillus pseudonomiae]KAB8263198.1 GTP cyclohydrolase N terminal-domain-containing protein [Aspergillus pseudonomiae]KAE8399630.1 GTP cyclohydrolase N terminal-domain-containing protein [Aspergillus pseudonomiae]